MPALLFALSKLSQFLNRFVQDRCVLDGFDRGDGQANRYFAHERPLEAQHFRRLIVQTNVKALQLPSVLVQLSALYFAYHESVRGDYFFPE